MGVLSNLRKIMFKAIDKSYEVGQLHGERRKNKDPRRVKLINTVTLSDEQKKSIDKLYSNVGVL